MKKFLTIILGALLVVSCGSTAKLVSQSADTTYKVGDFYYQNGLKGIVVLVDASGKHGTIMSLTGTNAKWCEDKSLFFETNAYYEDDGKKNMDIISTYVKENGLSMSVFPLFAWAKQLGDGWYIASKNEALAIWKSINGGSSRYNRSQFRDFDKKQRGYGGDNLVDTRFYIGTKQPFGWFTSTEAEGGLANYVQFGKDFKNSISFNPEIGITPIKKSYSIKLYLNTRAIHKF